jgi:hypothetical protein
MVYEKAELIVLSILSLIFLSFSIVYEPFLFVVGFALLLLARLV